MHTFWRVCVPQLVTLRCLREDIPEKHLFFRAQYIFFQPSIYEYTNIWSKVYGNYTTKDVLDNKCTVLKLTKTSKNIANVGLAR